MVEDHHTGYPGSRDHVSTGQRTRSEGTDGVFLYESGCDLSSGLHPWCRCNTLFRVVYGGSSLSWMLWVSLFFLKICVYNWTKKSPWCCYPPTIYSTFYHDVIDRMVSHIQRRDVSVGVCDCCSVPRPGPTQQFWFQRKTREVKTTDYIYSKDIFLRFFTFFRQKWKNS